MAPWLSLSSFALVLLAPVAARAEGSFLVVLEFTGPSALTARAAVVAGLEARGDRVELLPLSDLMATAREENAEELYGAALTRACAPLRLAGVIAGDVWGNAVELTLTACSDGSVVDRVRVPLRRRSLDAGRLATVLDRFLDQISSTGARRTGPALSGADAPRDGEEDDNGRDDDAAPERTEQGAAASRLPTARASFVSLSAGLEMGGRSFHYTDPITDNLRPYQLFGAPSMSLQGELYPLARTKVAVLRDLGATVSYALAFGLSSTLEGEGSIDTSWSRLLVGLRQRIRTTLGGPMLGVSVGFGLTDFGFAATESVPADELPDVSYSYLRGGLDARMAIARTIVLTASAGYMFVLSTGALDDRFPRATAGGADAAVGMAWRIAGPVALNLGVQYSRFFFTMNPQPGDDYVAGGALDEFLVFRLGASYAN